MVCKELVLELRTNKLKYISYSSLSIILLLLISSVIYLLVTVSHLNSIIDVNTSVPNSSELFAGEVIKPVVLDRQEIPFAQTKSMLINHTNNIKKELSEKISKMLLTLKLFTNTTINILEKELYHNFTKIRGMIHLNRKQDRTEMRSNFTEIVSSINILEKKLYQNLTKIRDLTHLNRKQDRMEMMNNFTEIVSTRNILKNNIMELQTQLFETNEQLNIALTGKHMYWGKCPGGWNETGGAYPVKVCVYN